MTRTLEQQMQDVFGPGFTMKDNLPNHDVFDENLKRDLESANGFDQRPYTLALQSILGDLTHAQSVMAISDYLAHEAASCQVANTIIVRGLETNLAAALVQTAKRANGPVEPLLQSSLVRIAEVASLAEVYSEN